LIGEKIIGGEVDAMGAPIFHQGLMVARRDQAITAAPAFFIGPTVDVAGVNPQYFGDRIGATAFGDDISGWIKHGGQGAAILHVSQDKIALIAIYGRILADLSNFIHRTVIKCAF
jgi:hypothetical protein